MNNDYKHISDEKANEREMIIFGRPYDRSRYVYGGCVHFDQISVTQAKELLEKGYVDPNDTQNCSPTMQEFIGYCSAEPNKWYLHGYVISPERSDCRVTFEGIGSLVPLYPEEVIDFLKDFRYADELYADVYSCAYCWYD